MPHARLRQQRASRLAACRWGHGQAAVTACTLVECHTAVAWSLASSVATLIASRAEGCHRPSVRTPVAAAAGHTAVAVGHLAVGGVADVCVLTTEGHWLVADVALRSQGKSTPFSGYELPGCVRATVVGGQVAFDI